jgi:hypothetical protein
LTKGTLSLIIKGERLTRADREIGRKSNRCLALKNAAHCKFATRVSQDDANFMVSLAEELIDLLKKRVSVRRRNG